MQSVNNGGYATFDLNNVTGNTVFDVAPGSTLQVSGVLANNWNGAAASLTRIDSGLMVLSDDNTYSGGTDVEGGTLEVTNSNAILYGTGLTVGTDGTVVFSDPPGAGVTMVATSLPAASPAGRVAAVPEPSTLALLGLAGIVAAAAAWRRRWN